MLRGPRGGVLCAARAAAAVGGTPAAALSSRRGAAWCDERATLIGEIDLVVLCDEHGAAAEAAVAEAERLRARLHELQAAERSQGDGRSYRSSRRERAEAKLEALRRRIEEVELEAERARRAPTPKGRSSRPLRDEVGLLRLPRPSTSTSPS